MVKEKLSLGINLFLFHPFALLDFANSIYSV